MACTHIVATQTCTLGANVRPNPSSKRTPHGTAELGCKLTVFIESISDSPGSPEETVVDRGLEPSKLVQFTGP